MNPRELYRFNLFSKMIKRFGVKGSTVINSCLSVSIALVATKLVTLGFGAPLTPLAILLSVMCPLILGTPWMYTHFMVLDEINRNEEELTAMNQKLGEALSEVKELSGLLPICSFCKKIRDDQGYWNQLELYVRNHSKAEFSHGICPDCAEALYPEYFKKK